MGGAIAGDGEGTDEKKEVDWYPQSTPRDVPSDFSAAVAPIENECADTTGTLPVPCAGHFQC